MTRHRLLAAAGAVLALTAAGLAPATAGGDHDDHDHENHHHFDDLTAIAALDSPRGVDTLGGGLTLVTEGDGSFSLVVERRHKDAKVIRLGTLGGDFAPAIAAGRHHTVWLLTPGGPPPEEGADTPLPATLYKWRPGWKKPRPFADIGAYQETDPDPFNQEGEPTESNPFGVAALASGAVLVADAAGNDLLRVSPRGDIRTVARLKPRVVEVPEGLPPPPDFPPAGTPITSEAVATSVTVKDGYFYIGELRGFPATPRTSQIWRVPAGTLNATCDPERPWRGPCKRFSDGLTSIVDLAPAPHGVYAVSLSKKSWLQWELGVAGSEIGGLFHVARGPEGKRHRHELVRNQLVNPAGVDATWGAIYVTAPIFGPGALYKVH